MNILTYICWRNLCVISLLKSRFVGTPFTLIILSVLISITCLVICTPTHHLELCSLTVLFWYYFHDSFSLCLLRFTCSKFRWVFSWIILIGHVQHLNQKIRKRLSWLFCGMFYFTIFEKIGAISKDFSFKKTEQEQNKSKTKQNIGTTYFNVSVPLPKKKIFGSETILPVIVLQWCGNSLKSRILAALITLALECIFPIASHLHTKHKRFHPKTTDEVMNINEKGTGLGMKNS